MAEKRVSIRIDSDTWESFGNYAKTNGSNASQMIRDYIEACLSGSPVKTVKTKERDNHSENVGQSDQGDLTERVEALEDILANFLEANKSDWEHQRQCNEAIKDQLKFMAMFEDTDPDPIPSEHDHKVKVLTEYPDLEGIGLNLDDTGETDDQSFDIKLWLEETIEANKNGNNGRTTKKDCLEYLRGYPHPLGEKWDNKGLNKLLNHYHLHWY